MFNNDFAGSIADSFEGNSLHQYRIIYGQSSSSHEAVHEKGINEHIAFPFVLGHFC